jgi:Protein of unknown function (DUF3261)
VTSSRVLGAAIVVGLAGCTSVPAVAPKGQVTLAPGIAFTLPPPASLGRPVEASQLVAARYRRETYVFETEVSVTPARILVVGTDVLGRRAMTIEWTGADLTVESAPWVPPELPARNVIADIVLLHWPDNAVRDGLTPGTTLSASDPGHRVIVASGHDMISIDRTAGTPGSWSGRWTLRNLGWGYDLDIQSTETAP